MTLESTSCEGHRVFRERRLDFAHDVSIADNVAEFHLSTDEASNPSSSLKGSAKKKAEAVRITIRSPFARHHDRHRARARSEGA